MENSQFTLFILLMYSVTEFKSNKNYMKKKNPDTTILKIEYITKSFPGVLALDKVSLDLRKGEVHAIVGENGAGKSTLMKILTGVYQYDEGRITFKDQEIYFNTPHEAMHKGISIIYQELNLIPHLTVAQNIFIGREPLLYGMVVDKKKMNDEASKLLSLLHINIDPNTILSKLSVSKQQMVEIAKALSFKSEIFNNGRTDFCPLGI